MASRGRNESCACGSGRKAKRCCGVARGPSSRELAKAFLSDQRRQAVRELIGVSRDRFEGLFADMVDLPRRDVSLQLRLPRLLSPALEALRVAIDADDRGAFDRAVDPALSEVDGPERRAELAGALRSLVGARRVDVEVAAVAMIDLTSDHSALVESALVEALAVSAGAARTPAGLLVVSR